MLNWPRLYLFLLLVLPPTFLAGQDLNENNFSRYTVDEGLSHNNVTAIAQDSTGYIWAATSSGLNRYNGSRFIQFHSNSDSLSLPAEDIGGMNWISKRRLAVYTAGLHIIDTRTGKTRNLFIPYHDKQFQYKFNMIETVMGDEEDNIYVLSRSGFYHFNKDYELVFRFDYYSEKDVPLEHFFFGRQLFQIDNNRFLITSIGGLFIYDKTKKAVHKMQRGDCPLLETFLKFGSDSTSWTRYQFFQAKPGSFFLLKRMSDTLVYLNLSVNKITISLLPFVAQLDEFHYRTKLVPANDTLLYLTGHSSGFYKMRFHPETGAVKFYSEKYFHSYLCYSVLTDMYGELWIATNKGLLHEDRGRSQVQVAYLPPPFGDSFPNIRYDDIYMRGNKIYAATRGSAGVFLFDKRTLRFERDVLAIHRIEGSNSVYAIAPINDKKILLGTGGPLFILDLETQKETPFVPPHWGDGDWTSDLFTDHNGNIWISAPNIYRYDPKAKTFDIIPAHERLLSIPFAIREDRDGNIWMAGHGLARYNTRVDSFDLFVDSFPFIKMHDKQINSMLIDPNNTIWFNSNNNGLIGYSIERKKFSHYTRSDGLPDDNIASMLIVGDKLWMACYTGLACMDLQTNQIVSFGREDGFPKMPIVKGANFYYDSVARQLYLGFSQALVRFDPYQMLRSKSPPNVFIENVAINGKSNDFQPAGEIKTSWNANEIMITIGSINFSDSYSQRFAYRIVKNDVTPWQQLGSQPSFSISNLSPGDYTIQVKTFSISNRWPEQVREIHIVVSPPFWRELWFIITLLALSALLLYLFIHWRTGVARRKEMQKTHIQTLKADTYKNQFELEQISNYFSSSLADKKNEEAVLWDVANNLIARMNYVDCMIYVWNDDKTKMVQKAAYGPKGKPEYISANVFEVLPGQGIVGHVMKTRQPLLVDDTRKDARYRVDDAFRLSEICVPINHNDELLGIIDSEHYEPGYFKERDIQILTTIATLIGNKLKQIESERSLEANKKELAYSNEQLAEAQLSALQAQMNPHFVFNALNSIKRMILDGDNENGSRYLSKFALMIRMTLNHSKDIFVTLDENVEYLKAYLEMEQLRFGDSFTYKIFTGENIDASEICIPSLMIQPLVENAIWHGLMYVEGEKKIKIAFTRQENKIVCTIEDNGIGIRQSEKLKQTTTPPHQSVGLENLKKRIKIMNEKYDTACSLEIKDLNENGRNGRGTMVVLGFNLINC
jgi:putative methionine-R-sulfoxide reductase with GAF domain